MTSRRNGREATAKGLTSATLPATTVVTKIPAPVEGGGEITHDEDKGQPGFHIKKLELFIYINVCVCVRLRLPNKAPTASPAVCGWEKAAIALKMSGAPLPRARKVTPSTQTPVKENILHKKNKQKTI